MHAKGKTLHKDILGGRDHEGLFNFAPTTMRVISVDLGNKAWYEQI